MKKEIKINIQDNLKRLDYYNMLEKPNKFTVNAWGIKSPGMISKERNKNRLKRKILSFITNLSKRLAILSLVLGIIFITFGFNKKETKAEENLLQKSINKYEYHILKKRCYKQQIDRLQKGLEVKEGRCEDINNLVKFRSSYGLRKAIDFIAKFEGVHLLAYYDHKQRSIGYGTKSYKGEKITLEEAKLRLEDAVKSRWELTKGLDLNKRIALTSFIYNAGNVSNIVGYARKGDYKSVAYIMSRTIYAGGMKQPGLIKRRKAEINLFFKK